MLTVMVKHMDPSRTIGLHYDCNGEAYGYFKDHRHARTMTVMVKNGSFKEWTIGAYHADCNGETYGSLKEWTIGVYHADCNGETYGSFKDRTIAVYHATVMVKHMDTSRTIGMYHADCNGETSGSFKDHRRVP